MIEQPGFFWTIASFLLVIGPLIFIHEMGHYLAGRWCGVKAEIFSIGFGREIAGWTDRRGTRWKIGWMPLGGYVKFKGDMNAASTPSDEWLALSPADRAETFQAKSVWQRFFIVAAGPFVNFLFAIIVFIGVFAYFGQPQTIPIVGGVAAGSPAAAAGIEAGDRVTAINGSAIDSFEEIARYVRIRPDHSMALVVEREGRTLRLDVTSRGEIERDSFGNEARVGRLGIVGSEARSFEPLAFYELPGAAIAQTGEIVQMMVVTLGQIVIGDRSVEEMGGPLKIAQYSGQQASIGWFAFLMFMTMISINLGFINLLPIPLLDGGHLFFYLIEAARGKALRPEAQEWAFRGGLAALLVLMIFVTLNDLASFGVWARLGGLIG